MEWKPCIFCGGACGRVCRGLGFKSSGANLPGKADGKVKLQASDKISSDHGSQARRDRSESGRSNPSAVPNFKPKGGVSVDKMQEAREQAPHLERGSTPLPSTKSKRGRPRIEDRDKTIEAQAPWKAAGMSRTSWYIRKRPKP